MSTGGRIIASLSRELSISLLSLAIMLSLDIISLSLAIMPSLAIIPSLVIISLEKLESLDSMMSGRIMSCCPGRIISL